MAVVYSVLSGMPSKGDVVNSIQGNRLKEIVMNTTLNKRWCLICPAGAERGGLYRIVIRQNGQAGHRIRRQRPEPTAGRHGKEQWNDTRTLRQKVNKRAEKEWDKADVAFDARTTARRARTSTRTGSPTPCAALTAAPVAPLPRNEWRPHGRHNQQNFAITQVLP